MTISLIFQKVRLRWGDYIAGSGNKELLYEHDYKITLKCTADAGSFYSTVYPGKVVRGYHCPPVHQPYWNTIYLDDFSDEELLNMIDHAYETVFKSFSKKIQKEILELNGERDGN